MPLLAKLIANLFGGVAAYFASFLTFKIATTAAAVAAFALSLVALMLAFNTIVSPLVAQMFSTQFGQFMGLAFPPAAGTCLAAISATWAACALYKLKIQSIKMSASA